MSINSSSCPSPFRFGLKFGLMLTSALFLVGCASPEDVQNRMDRQNETLSKIGTNAEIRQQARDARYDAAWDGIMH